MDCFLPEKLIILIGLCRREALGEVKVFEKWLKFSIFEI